MKYGTNLGVRNRWYWTDGNDVEFNGVYVHKDGQDLEWLNPKWWCRDDSAFGKGDAFRLFITIRYDNNDEMVGCWCNDYAYERHWYICEANI